MYKKIKSNLKNYTPSQLLSLFRSFLKSQKYSSATVRNYLSDVNKYFHFLASLISSSFPGKNLDDVYLTYVFSAQNLYAYLASTAQHPQSSRYLASLSLFFSFATSQQLITINPFLKVKKLLNQKTAPNPTNPIKAELVNSISQYQQFLQRQNISQAVIAQYINDLKEYINWLPELAQT
ncbi:MAG: hypothetical protein WC686_01855 [Candidatus Shapirobacteria bacterium]|jgi:site-specific recombinase XerD